jgi:hypothetical protein
MQRKEKKAEREEEEGEVLEGVGMSTLDAVYARNRSAEGKGEETSLEGRTETVRRRVLRREVVSSVAGRVVDLGLLARLANLDVAVGEESVSPERGNGEGVGVVG